MHKDVVILAGMPSEKAILTAAYPNNLVLSGTDKLNLDHLVPQSCVRIVSCGLAGGLAPGLAVADIVLADTLTDGTNKWKCDPLWNAAVAKIAHVSSGAWSNTVKTAPWYSSGTLDLADTKDQRAIIFNITGARAIDDESFYVAQFAEKRNIGFNVARSISDDWTETLPLAARGAILTAAGSVNFEVLVQDLLTEPVAQTLDLVKVASDYNASLATLQGFAQGVIL